MGNINKFRPLNGSARSSRNGPSFLVCALFIGLCIVSVSYYNLSNQYTKLYDSMADMIKQQKLLETHLEMKKNEQLNEKQKSAESLQKTQDELKDANKLIVSLFLSIKDEFQMKTKLLLSPKQIKTKEEFKKKDLELNDSLAKISKLSEELNKQKEQIEELTEKLFKVKNQNDINDKAGFDPKRKILDNKIVDNNQPINIQNENETRSKEAIKPKEDKKQVNTKVENRADPVINLLNKDKNTN